MNQEQTTNQGEEVQEKEKIGLLGYVVVFFLCFLLALPFAIMKYHWFNWLPVSDFIIKITIIIIFNILIIYNLFRHFKSWLVAFAFAVAVYLGINELRDKGLTYTKAKDSYSKMIESLLERNPNLINELKQGVIVAAEKEVINAVDYSNPNVKTFANKAATKYFTEDNDELFKRYGSVIRHLSIFKTVNNGWKYVEDPDGEEYFAKASESIQTLAGDCDDHTTLMVACIKATGGNARMVWVEGHIFPVVWVANDKHEFNVIIKPLIKNLFIKAYAEKSFSILETDEGIWLNFDYTKDYPGGPFMDKTIIKMTDV